MGASSRSYLFTSATVLFTLKCSTEPIRYVTHQLQDLQSTALLRYRNRAEEITVLVWTVALSGMTFVPAQKSSGIVSRFARVGWFSRALAFRSLYHPWGKMGTTRSLSVNIALAHTSEQFWLCQQISILYVMVRTRRKEANAMNTLGCIKVLTLLLSLLNFWVV